MARVTEAFIRQSFYRNFRKLSSGRREGILEALTVLHEAGDETEQPELPLSADDALEA